MRLSPHLGFDHRVARRASSSDPVPAVADDEHVAVAD
jgi:hypothetical protein